ncbi:hypothetical protein [Desulfovibrio sp. JC022]|uniref:hypothetical protein n=1 Tax=Desulfovibrio sp. JC022 TaxID=2593642 RepID=UPI0013D4E947|nr:hypothetical protein [Desulfovibrio sp. JC022]NDV21534.1 hypothetical protein [Desulfovibrio sp. JC022]
MNKIYTILVVTALFIATAAPAAALTIKNKCKYTVAGSITIAESMVSVAQFNIAPGESKKLLKGFEKKVLIIKTIPNIYDYDMDKYKITSIEIDNPDSHIELKQSQQGIKFKVE